MKEKQRIRKEFRTAVFERDNSKCRTCGEKAVDAHHITDRSIMPNGGYVLENGIALCSECHRKAEQFHISNGRAWVQGFCPNDLYEIINSSLELAHRMSYLKL